PPGATAIGVPGRIVGAEPPDHKQDLAHNKLPDPVAEAIRYWAVQQSKLEERIALLEDMLKESDANKDEKRK
ncbi:MAG TPA: serine O-acetyltransferase, partial [Candidatus Sumerlaeota bacterium]|nr:serine O-acetyltransferase [Candidatus Sumerlaeota bacterium]